MGRLSAGEGELGDFLGERRDDDLAGDDVGLGLLDDGENISGDVVAGRGEVNAAVGQVVEVHAGDEVAVGDSLGDVLRSRPRCLPRCRPR